MVGLMDVYSDGCKAFVQVDGMADTMVAKMVVMANWTVAQKAYTTEKNPVD